MAFWGCCSANLFTTLLHIPIAISNGVSSSLVTDYLLYTFLLGLVAFSARKDWHFRIIVNVGAALIYLHLWWSAFYGPFIGEGSIFTLPIMMFAPIWLAITQSYRALFLYSLVQAACIYAYTKYCARSVYGADMSAVELESFAIVLATVSATLVTMLAVMLYAREKTDKRLFTLIQETERLAAEDALTGLSNRRAFMEQIEALWHSRREFVVVFLDLDRFKPLNDEYGHAIGDQVLKTVSARLKEEPHFSAVARLGGDEFAAVIEAPREDDSLHASIVAAHDRITTPIDLDHISVTVGASIGYARALDDAASVSELLHASDTAMMRCKANNGGVIKFDPDLDDVGLLSSAFTEMFRFALKNNQIIPALQPIVDARTHCVVGHELLARWVNSGLSRDPTPAEFIPIAEKLGLLNDVLRVTLASAMRHLRYQSGFLAINVSPSQLGASSFLQLLKSIATENEFPLERIEIEITEHIAFRNLETNIQTLEKARRLGCTISLDDFGSGYSSLSLLDQLPLDKVKLDRSIQSARYKRDVLQATIRFAKELGFSCCVEGIESDDNAAVATKLGCDQLQGYWVGRPERIYPNLRYFKTAS